MENSSPPKDPLALGRHLVRELGLDDSTDTLGRWFAHELAEVMHRAEHADTEAGRARARREAVGLAAALWRRRDRLPGRAYPLAPFRRLLETLTVLRADERRRWWGANPEDQQAAALFQGFCNLMPLLFLQRVAPNEPRPQTEGAAYEALIPEERELLSDIEAWWDACEPEVGEVAPPEIRVVFAEEASGDSEQAEPVTDPVGDTVVALPELTSGAGQAKPPDNLAAPDAESPANAPEVEDEPAKLRRAALEWIDELVQQLVSLRATLSSDAPVPDVQPD